MGVKNWDRCFLQSWVYLLPNQNREQCFNHVYVCLMQHVLWVHYCYGTSHLSSVICQHRHLLCCPLSHRSTSVSIFVHSVLTPWPHALTHKNGALCPWFSHADLFHSNTTTLKMHMFKYLQKSSVGGFCENWWDCLTCVLISCLSPPVTHVCLLT